MTEQLTNGTDTWVPVDVAWDTDIGRDPDDFLAGCFLLSSPVIRLRAITISPGDPDQVALARFLLARTGNSHVPIGTVSGRRQPKQSLSPVHRRLLERYDAPPLASSDGGGWEILRDAFEKTPEATLLTTGPLDNVGALLKNTDLRIVRCVSMAGYWQAPGQSESLPEFNFNGCRWAAQKFVETDLFERRLLVGKNVTHRVSYDDTIHERLGNAGNTSYPLALAHELMSMRSQKRRKKLHDPLAASAVVREDLFRWEEVLPTERDGKWSSMPQRGTGIWAATDVDENWFRDLLCGSPAAESSNA